MSYKPALTRRSTPMNGTLSVLNGLLPDYQPRTWTQYTPSAFMPTATASST